MKHVKLIYLFTVFCAVALSPALVQAQTETLTNKSISDLVSAGLDKSIIITTIKNAAADFDLSANGLIALKNAKVDDDIIAAMVAKANGGGTGSETAHASAPTDYPEMVNHPYFNGRPLDKVIGKVTVVTKALGYAGGDQRYEVKGDKATIRVNSGEDVIFFINTGGAPLPELTLHKAEIKKGGRIVVLAKSRPFNLKGPTFDSGGKPLSFGATPLGNGVYKLVPTEGLEAGEYFFIPKDVNESRFDDYSFAFGIDN